jgi:predicted  nucleic acid-binding Zn-ribbon protein
MAKKKSVNPRRTTLEGLATIISKGFASSDRKFTALAEDINEIKSTMATKNDLVTLKIELKGDIAALGGQLTDIETALKSIRDELDDLREKFENVSGYRKEIDHALERIAAIEKHLGITKKIAA